MPLGAALDENQPVLGADAIDALRLKLRRFKDQLAFTKRHSDSPLPKLAWNKEDIGDLSALVRAVYMVDHQHGGTTAGKELLWVDRNHKKLRLLKTIKDMIAAVPSRPVAIIQRELVKIDPDYNPAYLRLRLEETTIARHKALEESNPRYRSLVKLSTALKEPQNGITSVRVDEFKEVLRELCQDTRPQLETGLPLLKDKLVERLISRTLFLELQRQELVWRLAYWDQVEAMAGWILELHNDELTKLLSDLAVYVPVTPKEHLDRRRKRAGRERTAKHRRARFTASDLPEQAPLKHPC